MPRDYIPTTDVKLVGYTANFNTRIVATPVPLGLTAAQATAYTTVQAAYVTAFNLINNDGTRTPAGIVAKDQAKANLIAMTRLLAGIIQKCPTVTNEQRSELGLTIRAASAPVPPPATSPVVEVQGVNGHTVSVLLHDAASSTKRGKPSGVSGASVFSYVGATPSSVISDWKFEANTTRTKFDIVFDPTVAPGAKVWVTAFWYNPRAQSGPACDPVGTNIQFGGMSMAA